MELIKTGYLNAINTDNNILLSGNNETSEEATILHDSMILTTIKIGWLDENVYITYQRSRTVQTQHNGKYLINELMDGDFVLQLVIPETIKGIVEYTYTIYSGKIFISIETTPENKEDILSNLDKIEYRFLSDF